MFLTALSILILSASVALADNDGASNFMGGTPSAGDLVEALRIDHPHGETRGFEKVRAIQVETGDCALVTRGLKVIPVKSAILDIKFEFASDELTGAAQSTLDQLGMALKAPDLASDVFVVEGHTDAVGSDAYNRELSKRRALAVRSYLRVWHGIKPERLAISCKGETELMDPNDPANAVNRRVHIINTG